MQSHNQIYKSEKTINALANTGIKETNNDSIFDWDIMNVQGKEEEKKDRKVQSKVKRKNAGNTLNKRLLICFSLYFCTTRRLHETPRVHTIKNPRKSEMIFLLSLRFEQVHLSVLTIFFTFFLFHFVNLWKFFPFFFLKKKNIYFFAGWCLIIYFFFSLICFFPFECEGACRILRLLFSPQVKVIT